LVEVVWSQKKLINHNYGASTNSSAVEVRTVEFSTLRIVDTFELPALAAAPVISIVNSD
jgi:hypothetical protein